MNKKIKELQDEIIELKQLNEQLKINQDENILYLEEMYPAINELEIKQGWYSGSHISTYKVIIDVYAEDLLKLIRFLTNKKLKEKKWSMISGEVKKQIKKEIEEEYLKKEE